LRDACSRASKQAQMRRKVGEPAVFTCAIGQQCGEKLQKGGKEEMFDYLIVGAGFAGSVIGERLATQMGKKVLIIDKRNHIGGNAYDCYNEDGILIHKYGPHIFHTNSERVFKYLSQFTEWRPYEHRVLAQVDGKLLPIPINRTTVNELYGLNLQTEEECQAFFNSLAEPVDHCRTSEDAVVSKVGRDLYEKFFRGYTRKQWGMDPSELDAQVTARIPTRTNTDDRYFGDTFQAMPLHGYTRMFEKMLSHPNIKIMVNTDYREIVDLIPYREMIFTGPVDQYFEYCYGKLPYRSLEFRHETVDEEQALPVAVVNYPNDHDYTRVTEFKQLTGQEHRKTGVVYEYPRAEGDPYYPIPKPECSALYAKYKALAEATPGVHFVGRLATYKYYNMDQVVAQALATYEKLSTREKERAALPASQKMPARGVPATPIQAPMAARMARDSNGKSASGTSSRMAVLAADDDD
jgi:UDP-galactopyranose mutase